MPLAGRTGEVCWPDAYFQKLPVDGLEYHLEYRISWILLDAIGS